MTSRITGHGGPLSLLIVVALATAARGDDPVRVPTRIIDIEYTVADSAQPLDAVQLWYTQDGGQTWHLYGVDEDRQPPITFHAPAEGEFAFFFVLSNSTGASSSPPDASIAPHLHAFIDFTPPVVQLHELRQTTALGQRILQLRWSAIDSNLVTRPVEIEYRQAPDTTWLPATSEPLSNTGRFDWRLPESLAGAIGVRLAVFDRGGHRVSSEIQEIELLPRPAAAAQHVDLADTAKPVLAGLALDAPAVSAATRARAVQLQAEAAELGELGDYREGVARLREAVRLHPQLTEAFAEMGGLLYLLGDLDRAQQAYEIALNQQPRLRQALQGVARVYRQQHRYPEAADSLRSILRYDPMDAEIWMNLGDIAVYQGDELLARDCYQRAADADPTAVEIADRARQRLALMAEVSRRYRGEEP